MPSGPFSRLPVALILFGLPAAAWADKPASPGAPELFARRIHPLTQRYCFGCHAPDKLKGDLDLKQFRSFQDVRDHPEIWERVAERLEDEEMPPDGKPQPTAAQREQMVDWADAVLNALEHEHDGDPGQVVLRRLSNAEYTYTVRDLTGLASLDPAREFPADSAAGEGFMNVGQALVMSPQLLRQYLDAATAVASHAVLLPDGIAFSEKTTHRDETEEIEGKIRALYRCYADVPPDVLNLQGVTNDEANIHQPAKGGRLPLERYLDAMVRERVALQSGAKSPEAVARASQLSPKYAAILWRTLAGTDPSPLLDRVRARWRLGRPEDVSALEAEIGQWQQSLWNFNFVGMPDDNGREKTWMEPARLVSEKRELRLKLTAPAGGGAIVALLAAGDAGDGPAGDDLEWREPRLVHAGQPTLLLRDVREYTRELTERRDRIFADTAAYLAAASEIGGAKGEVDLAALARRRHLDAASLRAWLDYLGIGPSDSIRLADFSHPLAKMTGWDFISGWGSLYSPGMVANPSDDQLVRIPGLMPPHSVAVQPSATEYAAGGWRSPIAGVVRIEASVFDQFPEVNHGFIWSLELRHGRRRTRLATGVPHLSTSSPNYGKGEIGPEVVIPPMDGVRIEPGDLISLVIGPWEGDNNGDLIGLRLKITSAGPNSHRWSMEREVSGNVLAGNPHDDDAGHPGVWHFYSEPFQDVHLPTIPAGSVLARWLAADSPWARWRLARAAQRLLTSAQPATAGPDAALWRQATSLGGPFLAADRREIAAALKDRPSHRPLPSGWGLDPSGFGRHSEKGLEDAASLFVQAPSLVEVSLPADLFAESELVVTARLRTDRSSAGTVQPELLAAKPASLATLLPGVPILAAPGSPAGKRLVASCDEFQRVFPPYLCYSDIVPIDQGETLVQYHRDDRHYSELMLGGAERAGLDRLWDQLQYVSREPLSTVDLYEDIFAQPQKLPPKFPRNADPRAAAVTGPAKSLGEAIHARGAAFAQRLLDTEPRHLSAILEFADRAYRRPLTGQEKSALLGCYRQLRQLKLSHEEAVRLTLARVLVAPAFLYRLESPGPALVSIPVDADELATRLSYFLWSSEPDAELRAAAASGKLTDPEVLAGQARRMLADPRVRHLATEFGCTWLQIHDFDQYDEKSARVFPTFAALRGDMYEEAVEFMADLFQNDRPVLNLIDADYTFLDEALARHYGIPGVLGPQWRRVDGIRKYSRGGIFAQAAFLAKRSGASRSSPILRGSWIATTVLGVNVPPPPKVVPPLPDGEAAANLSVRQLTERHVSNPACSVCHARFDAYGFALENFDGIGRWRDKEPGNVPVDAKARIVDGPEIDGIAGLRNYLLTKKRDAFVTQFCRKLLGYALGRSIQFSDESLVKTMKARLAASGYRADTAIEAIVRSPQFREIRGRQIAASN